MKELITEQEHTSSMDDLLKLRHKHISYLMKRGMSKEEAEDILHEAYMSCLKNNTNDEKWLHACLKNQTKDVYRRRKLEENRIAQGEIENVSGKINEEKRIINRLFILEIKEQLDIEEATVIDKKLEGKTSFEIGKEMGIEDYQVRQIFSRIRKKIARK